MNKFRKKIKQNKDKSKKINKRKYKKKIIKKKRKFSIQNHLLKQSRVL